MKVKGDIKVFLLSTDYFKNVKETSSHLQDECRVEQL